MNRGNNKLNLAGLLEVAACILHHGHRSSFGRRVG